LLPTEEEAKTTRKSEEDNIEDPEKAKVRTQDNKHKELKELKGVKE
jgi:hypothetical protein